MSIQDTPSTANPPSANQQKPAPSPGRARRIFTWIVAILALLAVLLAATAFVLLRTEWGARTLWENAGRFVPGELSGEFQGGTLSDGLRLRNVAYRDESKQIKIDRVDAAWSFSWSPAGLHIRSLEIGTVDATLAPSPPDTEPAKLPARIALPVRLELEQAAIQQVLLHQGGTDSRYADIRLSASSDKVHHQLRLRNAVTPYGTAKGEFQLTGEQPFPIKGTASLATQYRDQPVTVNTNLDGSLQDLAVRLTANGAGLDGNADIQATPFADVPLRQAQVRIRGFDPRALNPEWPQAKIDVDAALKPAADSGNQSGLVVAGPVEVRNSEAGPIDAARVPLKSLRADVRLDAERQRLERFQASLSGDATLEGSGELRSGGNGEFAFRASGLDLHALHGALVTTAMSGPIDIGLKDETQTVRLDLVGPKLSARADATLDPGTVTLHSARLGTGPAALAIKGSLARSEPSTFSFTGSLSKFDPALVLANVRPAQIDAKTRARVAEIDANINMQFKADGRLSPEPAAKVSFDVQDSRYAGLPLTGGGLVQFEGKRILPSDARISIAGNDVSLKGSFGQPSDRLAFNADAPHLGRLGYGLSGSLRASGELGGTIENPRVDARYHAEGLTAGAHRLALLDGSAKVNGLPGSAPDAGIVLDLTARDLRSGELRLDSINAAVNGRYTQHTARLEADGRMRGARLDMTLAAQGNLQRENQGYLWDGTVRTMENRGLPALLLESPVTLSVAPGRVTVGAARLTFAQARIDLQGLDYANGRLRSEGGFSALDVGRVLALQQQITGNKPPLQTNLVLDGSWDLALADTASGFLRIERRSGDINLPGPVAGRTLGLEALSLRADLQGQKVALTTQARARRIGSLEGNGTIALQQQDGSWTVAPDAAVEGRVTASIPKLSDIAALAGPRIALNGQVGFDIGIKGSLAEPRLSGTINGDQLALNLYEQGVSLSDGIARIVVDDNVIDLKQVLFRGGDGTLTMTGRIPLFDESQGLQANITADKLQLLASPSGQLTLSGQATAARLNEQMQVTGKFIVDRALFSLPEKSAPKLDGDVVVIRGDEPPPEKPVAGEAPKASPYAPRIDVTVGLGDNFRFAGAGADLRLVGTVRVVGEPSESPQAFGTVRIVEGTYEAFGTELEVEQGIITFQGPLANPNLNILAMRRNQEVAAGVQVTGTVSQPRVQLVSEPNVAEEEKLSWLIFGRSGGSGAQGQAQSAAKGAALGLLNKFGGARIAKGFGLDEFSIGASESGLGSDQVVNLGKELTDRLFIGYEQSLSGAESVLKLTYELTRYWQIVLRGGTVAGLNLFYNRRFDSLGERRLVPSAASGESTEESRLKP